MSVHIKRFIECLFKGLFLALIFITAVFLAPQKVFTATFNIGPSDTTGLINAIGLANTNDESDTINLAADSLYELTTVNNDSYSDTGLPLITSEITINGNGSTISRNSAQRFRILAIESPGNLTLNDTSITNGFSEDSLNGGGGIFNIDGVLDVNNSRVYQNVAQNGGGGGLWLGGSSYTRIFESLVDLNQTLLDGSGGGLVKRGSGNLDLINSVIERNSTQNNGGASYSNASGNIYITNSQFNNNLAKNHAGALHNHAGDINIQNSIFSDNEITGTATSFRLGGAIYNASDGNISITNSELYNNNTADNNGGALHNLGIASINDSCIEGNSSNAINNLSGSLINAQQNYWGSTDGPAGAGGGSGDSISGNILFNPFLTTCPVGAPVEEETIPIVLLPGLGASWDTSAMITGGPGDDWKLTPFVKVYDNFRNTFLNNEDYALGENYFEFYYDWRQPLGELTDDLDNFLNDTVLIGKPENTKANLVGHSMGGLLATAYSNEYGLDKVNQVVTVGSPHQGAIPAWTVWSGAEQTEKWSWEWLGLQLYLQLQKGKFASPVDAVHNLTPGMNNLLPIFDFAKDSSDQVIPVGSMSAVNYYLADLQTNLTAAFKNILATFAGKEDNLDHDTIEWIKLSDRSLADQLLNKWPDGKPDSYEYTEDGDLTVLQNSALVLGASSSGIINASHNYLLENQLGIQAVLDALGLTELSPSTDFTSPPRSPALVFLLHSPAQIMVMLPGGSQAGYGIGSPAGNVFYSEEDKLLIIYDAQNGDYHIEVIGIDEGSYELEIGQLTETDDVWTTIAGETALDQVDEYAIDFTSEDPDYQPLIDEIGQTQLNMAKIILMQIEEQIIQLDLPEIKEVELLDYLGSLQNFIAKASTKIDEGNFKLAQRYLRTIMKGVYSLRQKLDKVSLEDEARFELKAKAHQAGLLLIDAYVNTLNQSGIILKPKAVNTHLKNTQKVIDRVTKKLAKIEGENVWAGDAYQLSLTMLLKANEANDDGNLPEAVAKSIVSRILALEASKLIN